MRTCLLVLMALVIGGCAATAPTRPADITGVVTRLTIGNDGPQILVEENPADAAGSGKALVRTGGSTHWFSGGATFDASKLKQGMRVSVWFDGPVATSYPVQAVASDVVILGTSAP
jgi:beta-N-acetylhexosaminidase